MKKPLAITLLIVIVVAIISLFFMPAKKETKPLPASSKDTDSVYVYYRGDIGYIRFKEPMHQADTEAKYNQFPNHSKIPDLHKHKK